MKSTKHKGRTIIVVPTTPLKNQWEQVMKKLGLYVNIEVHVINTVALTDGFYRDCELFVSCGKFIAATICKYDVWSLPA